MTLALQVRYATGAIRNISVEEVGKRIVKQIPNVLQQLAQLGSSADQVHVAAHGLQRQLQLQRVFRFVFLLLTPPPTPSQATARYAAAALKSLS